MAQFTPQIQAWVLASEGGYVDHPDDPGGATNMGITHRTLAAWRKVPSVAKDDVRNLTRAEALRIYESQYWNASGADRLPVGLDYAVFDYAVNSGPARAVKDLQRVVGAGVDGVMGVQTLAAVSARPSADLIRALSDRRRAFVRALRTYEQFGRGWERRITSVENNALSLVGFDTATTPAPSEGQAAPERPSAPGVLTEWGGLSGIAGALSGILGAINNQPILQVAAVLFIGVLLWRFIVARRQADPA